MPLDTPIPVKRALISVSDKTGLAEFGRFLSQQGVEILSTGGSARMLAEAGIAVTEVAAHTGFPEIMDGRVKTLHPKIHGGILARRDLAAHRAAMEEHGIAGIDMVVSNLYPFEATLASGADFDTCVENIDIGGPAMVRASAKNHDFVTIVTDPEDYGAVEAEMTANGGAVGAALRRRLAMAAFAHTAAYDSMIARWLAGEVGETFPKRLTAGGALKQTLRYGENPHQEAAVYLQGPARPGVATAEQLQGKQLSYNNLNDTNAAFELVSEFEAPTVAIIKHANPCGVASRDDLAAAYGEALACDPVSAFGGIIAVNRSLDAKTAEEVAKLFAEVVIAPAVDAAAQAVLAQKKNLRVLVTGAMADPAAPGTVMTPLAGGFLAQSRDNGRIAPEALKVVTKREPRRPGTGRYDLRLPGRQAREVERHRLRARRRHRRHRRGPDEPGRFIAHRRLEGARGRGRWRDAQDGGVGGRLRCLLSLRRRAAGRSGSRRQGRHPARRVDARRRGDCRRRRGRHRHGLHRHAALPPLRRFPPGP